MILMPTSSAVTIISTPANMWFPLPPPAITGEARERGGKGIHAILSAPQAPLFSHVNDPLPLNAPLIAT